MKEKNAIEQIRRKFEKRKNTTRKALEDLKKILEALQAPDHISGYYTNKTFEIKFHYWRGDGWVYSKWDACFGYVDGIATIVNSSNYTEHIFDYLNKLSELDYINLAKTQEALREFIIERITSMPTFEDITKKFEKIVQILQK